MVAIWLGCVSMKKLFELLAQAGNTADWPAPSASICTVEIVTPLFLMLVHSALMRALGVQAAAVKELTALLEICDRVMVPVDRSFDSNSEVE